MPTRPSRRLRTYLNMQRCVYRRYELGEREIPVWAVIRLAEYYHVSTDYLLRLTERKNEAPVPVHSRLFRSAAPRAWRIFAPARIFWRQLLRRSACWRWGSGSNCICSGFLPALLGLSLALAWCGSIGQCCFVRLRRSARGSRQRFRRRFWNIRQARAMDVPFLFAWRPRAPGIRAGALLLVR